MKVTLFGIPGSHPVMSARLMLKHKGIEYRRVDLLPVMSRAMMRALGFPGNRVPALRIDGRRIQGTQQISRELDRIKPDPPLFPADPDRRRAVEEAEAWGDPFQQIPRTIIWWALKREPSAQVGFLEDAKLGLPATVLAKTSAPIVWGARRLNDSYDETVERTLAELPPALDKIDGWIADGVLNGAEPNAADFQIAPTLRLLMSFADLEPLIAERPAGRLATRLLPTPPGHIGPVFPVAWLAPLRPAAPAATPGA